MIVNYKTIDSIIEYPVFLLPSGNWDVQDGLLILEDLVVDDKNKEGRTLGARRMQTAHKDVMPLKKMLTSYNGILKQKTRCFIDNVGVPFIYEKTKFVPDKFDATSLIFDDKNDTIKELKSKIKKRDYRKALAA